MNYFQDFLVFVSTVSGCVLTSGLDLLTGIPIGIASSAVTGIPIGIASSAVGLKLGVITTESEFLSQPSRKKETTR